MFAVLALGALETMINRWVDLDAATRKGFDGLAGKTLRVVMTSPQLSVDVLFDTGRIRLSPTVMGMNEAYSVPSVFEQRPYDVKAAPIKASTTLSVSTLVDLLTLATRPATSGGNLPVSGDLSFLQSIQHVLAQAQPDLAYRLSPVLGDVAAEQFANGLNSLRTHFVKTLGVIGEHGADWLKEDSQLFAPRWQVDQFVFGVQALSTNIERLQAKINAFEKTTNYNSTDTSINASSVTTETMTTKDSNPLFTESTAL